MTKCTHKQLMTACMLAGTLMLGACTSTPPVTKEVSIVPITNHLEETNGAFVLKSNTSIGVIDAELIPAAEYLADMLSSATGYDLKVKEGEGTITLALGDVQGKEGAYTLTAESDKVNITGNSYGGVIAGIESLRQLFPPQIESKEIVKGTDWAIPAVNIQDAPRFEWRGIMLDVSRHFYTIDEVKELLDVMALYKMNKFHWHLTDDQGWRIEIKKYPLLTEKGAWRKFNSHDRECIRQSKTDNNPDMAIPEDKIRIVEGDTLYGGYYTQEDIKDVIAYAKIRGIDIIPEIDMPGHMLAAVSNYEGVSCFNETGWGSVFSSPVCPGKDSALEFCKNVYAELIALFPYKYVHIGGDEVEKTNWKKCPDCQKRMHDNNLKTEEELQSWFIHDMERFFNGKGKEMIGWDEIIEGGLSKTATVMWWRSWVKDAATKATAQGNPVIFTPNGQFYLDYAEDKNSMASIYNLDTTDNLTPEQQSLILGVQGNIWCEWIPSNARMQYMAIPRLLAIAELGWSKPEQKDWNAFKQRLSDQFERLNIMGINYRIPDLEGFNAVNAFIGEDRHIVTDIAGTTRDSIYTKYNKFGLNFYLVDTAGIRKKGKVNEDLEYYSVIRSIRAIENSDVCVLMLDATRGIESQDLNIFSLVQKNKKGLVVCVNKWDLVEDKSQKVIDTFMNAIRERLAPFTDFPILFISALTKQRILKVLETAKDVYENRQRRVPTAKLNETMLPIIENYPPPAWKGKYIKIKYITQLPAGQVPSFVFFCNLPQWIKDPYKRFLENKIRENWNFTGTPINVFIREK